MLESNLADNFRASERTRRTNYVHDTFQMNLCWGASPLLFAFNGALMHLHNFCNTKTKIQLLSYFNLTNSQPACRFYASGNSNAQVNPHRGALNQLFDHYRGLFKFKYIKQSINTHDYACRRPKRLT